LQNKKLSSCKLKLTTNKQTKQVKNYLWIYHSINSMLQAKTLYHTEKHRFGYLWLSKNSSHTHQNLLKLSPVSERSAYSLQSYICFSLLTSGLESLATNLLPLIGPGFRPTVLIQTSTKIIGA